MIIQGSNTPAAQYAAMLPSLPGRQEAPAAANLSETVNLSGAGKALAATAAGSDEERALESRLAANAQSANPMEMLLAQGKRMAEIYAKPPETWSSAEMAYVQKSVGFVNSIAKLSIAEKQAYNQMVAQGNWRGAQALSWTAPVETSARASA